MVAEFLGSFVWNVMEWVQILLYTLIFSLSILFQVLAVAFVLGHISGADRGGGGGGGGGLATPFHQFFYAT